MNPVIQVPQFYRRFWRDYLAGLIALLVTNALAASIPLKIKTILEAVSGNQLSVMGIQLLWILGAMVVMFGVRVLSRYWLIGVGRKIEYDLRQQLYSHLMHLPRGFYDVHQSGELMSRLTNDLTAIRMFYGGGMMLIANVVFAYAMMLPIMMGLSWRLTLLTFLLYPIVMLGMRSLSASVKRHSNAVQDALGEITATVQENLSGIQVIQGYAKNHRESQRFYDKSLQYFHATVSLVKTRAVLYILIAAVSGLSVFAVLLEGGREVIIGALSLSGLAAFMLYLERLSWPTVSMGWMLSSWQQAIVAMQRINQVMAFSPNVDDRDADPKMTVFPAGGVHVRALSFSYAVNQAYQLNTSEYLPVLKNVSFEVFPGELVAIVGPIGAGKSTLLNLLARQYPVSSNQVCYGNQSIEKIPLDLLRQHVALMPQNSILFSETLFHNLAYAIPESQPEPVYTASQELTLETDVMQFPKRYETLVGERGVTLSGGQRQRSALIRTVLMSTPILLLDDPVSAVDGQTEEQIITALQARHRAASDKITIFSSHRFAWVRQADKILVLTATGTLADSGTHEELMQRCALYQQLHDAQLEPESQASLEVA